MKMPESSRFSRKTPRGLNLDWVSCKIVKLCPMSPAELLGMIERHAQQKLLPLYTRRRTTVKAVPKFWPVALMNHSVFASQAQHNADQLALSYLEDLWMVRDKVETRCFTLEFVCHERQSRGPHRHSQRGSVAVFQRKSLLHEQSTQEGIQIHPVD